MLINADKLRELVIRENTVTMRRLMSAIDRVDKEDAILVQWLRDKANEYFDGGHEDVARIINMIIEEYRGETE